MTDYLHRSTDYQRAEIASVFDEVSLWSSHFGTLLLEQLMLRADESVMDLGCGSGFPLFELAHQLGASCHVVGVDLWKAALARAAGKRHTYETANVSLVEGDGARLPFRDDSFDLIVSNVGVNNFENAQLALAECARVTRAGGRLALTTNPSGHMRELYGAYRDTLRALGKEHHLQALDNQEAHRSTREAISRMLEDAGYTVTKKAEGSFTLRYLNARAFMQHPLTRFGFLDGWRSFLTAEEEEETFAALEETLDARASAGGIEMTVPTLYLESTRNVT